MYNKDKQVITPKQTTMQVTKQVTFDQDLLNAVIKAKPELQDLTLDQIMRVLLRGVIARAYNKALPSRERHSKTASNALA